MAEFNDSHKKIHKKLGLYDIARLILIVYCLAPIFKTMLDTILIYSFQIQYQDHGVKNVKNLVLS